MPNILDEIEWKELDLTGFLNLIPDDQTAIQFSISSRLIDQGRLCECGSNMNIRKNSQERYGYQFICAAGRRCCRKTKSLLSDSWFSRSRIGVRAGLLCIMGYAMESTNKQFRFITGLASDETITNWRSFFRNICAEVVDIENQPMIGGIGYTIELDECLVFKRKNNTGRLLASEVNHSWIFGGICRENGQVFITKVERRDAETLLSAIQQHIQPGTRLITDCWRGYRQLSENGFEHVTVNHSENFVHPQDASINTQRIERLWRTLKKTIPRSSSLQTRWSYLPEFLFKQNNGWYSKSIGERSELIIRSLINLRFN